MTSDPRPLFARAVALGADVVATVRPDQLHGPTPCDAFDVAALLDHLVMVVQRTAAIGRGEPAMSVQPEARTGGWAEAYRAAAADNLSAWADDASLDRKVTLPWTEMTGADTLRTYTSEVTVHTWDLAHATGQRPAWDDTVVAEALAAMQHELPAEGRREMLEESLRHLPPGTPASFPFAEAVAVPADAPLIEQLVAWTGRDPRAA
ncbi:MAG TPA: TIGR03086 family metal-binding protein [Acidimicrobiales bacterium]|nr:TIGR03086 family metal-binding protein [Acidimicrobiales bacterium]